jgi:hypothetical protein
MTRPSDSVKALLTTLSNIAERSLRQAHGHLSLRLVHPMGSWTVEAGTVPGALIVTLGTPDSSARSKTRRE